VNKSNFSDASTGHYRASQGHFRMPDVTWEIAFNPGNPGSESNFPDVVHRQGIVTRQPSTLDTKYDMDVYLYLLVS
jgi:hypothetical protein